MNVQAAPKEDRQGLIAAFVAYALWGGFPFYFHLLAAAGAVEIVAHRIVWTLVFCVVGVCLIGAWGKVRRVFADRALTWTLLGAGVLVSLNWLIYVYAVVTEQVVDAALGYFINPLVTVVLAMVFLRESITIGQGVALGIGLVAVIVITVGVGRFPLIGLGLALTFGLYSLAKHRVGGQASPFIGLGVEALTLAPFSLAYIVYLEITRQGTFTSISMTHSLLLAAAGAVTAIPLLFFAVGAARLRLVSLAFIQYVAPILQFLIGVVVLHESMPPVRWAGFILVWCALVVLSWDTWRRSRRQ